MTTEIIHAPPGSFKTASLLSLYLRDAVKQNRLVITNVRGLDNVNKIKKVLGYKKSTFQLINVGFDKDGFQRLACFYQWAPKGAIVLMDEGQRVYPSRLRSLSEFDFTDYTDFDDGTPRPDTLEEAFDTHRHNGWDIYISTPNIAKIHKEIRQVAEFAYRHKNLKGFISLPFMSGRYKRVKHDAENNGKSITYQISSTIEKIDKKVFSIYDSTQTGNAKDIKASNELFSSPKFILVLCIIVYVLYSLIFSPSFRDNSVLSSQDIPTINSIDPVQEFVENNIEKVSDVSSGNVSNRPNDSLDNVIELLYSIQYFSGSILRQTGDRFYTIFFFETESGRITSRGLTKLGIEFSSFDGYYLLTYNDHQHLIPVGNPNPDYYHPDDQQQFTVQTPTNEPQNTLF